MSELKKWDTVNAESIQMAYQRIKGDIIESPIQFSESLSELTGANVYLKMEHLQLTGSFKIRGVLNKTKGLSKEEYERPFVAASTGNHAAAFAYAAEKFGFSGTLFLPLNVNKNKFKALEPYKIKKVLVGNNSAETEAHATNHAKEIDGVLVHPYNDMKIIEGQGTMGVEIEKQLPTVDAIITPIGGGGLASGLASYFKHNNKVEVVGCQPINASEMLQSIQANKIVEPSTSTTIADAAAGGLEPDALTYSICKKYIKSIETADEKQIREAIYKFYQYENIVVEPTAAIPLASLLKGNKYAGRNVVLVLTGKKIEPDLLKKIREEYGDNN